MRLDLKKYDYMLPRSGFQWKGFLRDDHLKKEDSSRTEKKKKTVKKELRSAEVSLSCRTPPSTCAEV